MTMRREDDETATAETANADQIQRPQAAQRALAAAPARRCAGRLGRFTAPKEVNGRGGLDPARYGDWEVKGIASDF
jgi:hypothetical protein